MKSGCDALVQCGPDGENAAKAVSVRRGGSEGAMDAFAITVEFRLKPGMLESFRPLMDENARASMRDEPGCRRFDVLQALGEQDVIFLYEIYDDRAAFEAHVRTPHFLKFQAETASLVAAKKVVEYELVCEGGKIRP